jgi:hypothetical protein
MIGQRFGRLIVIGEAERYVAPKTGKPSRRWLCRCECGGQAVSTASKLRSGHTKSCGCLQAENRTKHGHHGTGAYRTWDAMIQRCHNERHTKFYMYGARGITVCDRWRKFENFLADMGERPDNASLDRIDGAGNYEPGNCRWATRREQQRNMRSNHVVEFRGARRTVSEVAELTGVDRNRLYPLLNHSGLSIEDAVQRAGG